MRLERVVCDIKGCKAEVKIDSSKKTAVTVPVRFLTETTEGRCVEPYLKLISIDICTDCLAKLIGRLPIEGHGAQGYNEYYFKEQNDKS